MDRVKVRDSNMIIILPKSMSLEEIKKSFLQYIENYYFKLTIEKKNKIKEDYLLYFEKEPDKTDRNKYCISFSNGCDDIVIGIIFHSFCIYNNIEIIEFQK